jgi:hypothetical protein
MKYEFKFRGSNKPLVTKITTVIIFPQWSSFQFDHLSSLIDRDPHIKEILNSYFFSLLHDWLKNNHEYLIQHLESFK